METMRAIVLGIVQGLTEFLPVSSSGHLVIIPWALKWKDLGLSFDVALHLGTLLALAVYFFKDWLDIIKNWKKPLLWLIALGCIPGAAAGYKFEKYFETVFRSPLYVGIFVIGAGVILWIAEMYSRKEREIDSLTVTDALIIGFAQALALMPGISRSGITISAGLFTGFKRESAARFSFLLAMPITFGAGLLKMKEVIKFGLPKTEQHLFYLGIIAAAISGYFAIKYLLKFLQNHTLLGFVYYRMIFGVAIILLYFLR